MGQPKRKKREPSPEKRRAILDAALELFAERGYYGASVPQIAEDANVGLGTVYRYFKDKEDLVNVLFREWKEKLYQTVVKDYPATAPAREQFRVFWARLCIFALNHPSGLQFLEMHHHAPYLDKESRDTEDMVLFLVRGYVERAQKQRALKRMRVEVLIALVWGAFVGLVKAGELGYVQLQGSVLEETEQMVWEAISA